MEGVRGRWAKRTIVNTCAEGTITLGEGVAQTGVKTARL